MSEYLSRRTVRSLTQLKPEGKQDPLTPLLGTPTVLCSSVRSKTKKHSGRKQGGM